MGICLHVGDRLAAISAVLAQRYYRRAAAAWTAFGADGFERWVALGRTVGQRRAAVPRRRDGVLRARAVRFRPRRARTPRPPGAPSGRISPSARNKLAATFFRTTGIAAATQPTAWRVSARGSRSAASSTDSTAGRASSSPQAYFAAAPQAVVILDPAAYRLWAGAGAALYPAVKEREFFAHLPRGAARLGRGRASGSAAHRDRAGGAGGEGGRGALPRAAPVAREPRRSGPRRRCCARCVRPASGWRARPPTSRRWRARWCCRCPRRNGSTHWRSSSGSPPPVPAATVAALRALPRVYEEAAPAMVREWFDAGLRVAARQCRCRHGLLRARVAHQPQGAARQPRSRRPSRRCRACCASTCRC